MAAQRGLTWCVILSLIGLGVAGYLVYPHLGLLRGELLGGAACSGTGMMNCHAVTGSTYGSLLGMPLALWGLIGYLVVLALSVLGRQSPEWATQALTLIVGLAALFVLVDVVLLALMVWVIRYVCVLCLITYAVNLGLLGSAWLSLARPVGRIVGDLPGALGAVCPSRQRPAAWFFWGMVLTGSIGVLGLHLGTTFVSRGTLGSLRGKIRDYVSQQPRVQVDVGGNPVIGRPDAPLQIIEFSDFLCPACQQASRINKIFLASHRRHAVFVFKHYPLDSSCNQFVRRVVHPGACQAAAATACANLQGRFWPLHDRVFQQGPAYRVADLQDDARRLGMDMDRFQQCLSAGEGMEAVRRDIAEAGRLELSSTPTYIVNGVVMSGIMKPSVLEDLAAVLWEGR